MSAEIRRCNRAGSEFLMVPPGPEQGGGPRSRIRSRRQTFPHHLVDAARDPSRRIQRYRDLWMRQNRRGESRGEMIRTTAKRRPMMGTFPHGVSCMRGLREVIRLVRMPAKLSPP